MRHLCNNSKSPMETDIAIMLLLPLRLGGRGLSKPALNRRIDVPRSMRRILPQSYFELDLFWPEAAIALEYDSSEHHEGAAAAAHDAIRTNGIEDLGIRVVTMTKQQALDPVEFDRIATILAKQTGKRPRELSPKLLAKQTELRDTLFARFRQDRPPCLYAVRAAGNSSAA